jgi:hypothetical protein
VVAGGVASTRTGSLSSALVSSAILGAMVAENSAVCRRGPIAAAICFTGPMKPMSSMRSASSRTSQRVSLRRSLRSSSRSLSRPGVAMTTSTPRRSSAPALAGDAAQDQHGGKPHAVGELAQHLVDLHRELAGRREDQRPRRHRVGAALERGNAGEDGQAEGGRLARAGLGDAHDVAALELGPMALAWMGVGMVNPALVSAATSCAGRPSSEKCLGQRLSHVWPRASQSARKAPAHHARAVHIEAMATGRAARLRFRPASIHRGTSPLTALADKKRSQVAILGANPQAGISLAPATERHMGHAAANSKVNRGIGEAGLRSQIPPYQS